MIDCPNQSQTLSVFPWLLTRNRLQARQARQATVGNPFFHSIPTNRGTGPARIQCWWPVHFAPEAPLEARTALGLRDKKKPFPLRLPLRYGYAHHHQGNQRRDHHRRVPLLFSPPTPRPPNRKGRKKAPSASITSPRIPLPLPLLSPLPQTPLSPPYCGERPWGLNPSSLALLQRYQSSRAQCSKTEASASTQTFYRNSSHQQAGLNSLRACLCSLSN